MTAGNCTQEPSLQDSVRTRGEARSSEARIEILASEHLRRRAVQRNTRSLDTIIFSLSQCVNQSWDFLGIFGFVLQFVRGRGTGGRQGVLRLLIYRQFCILAQGSKKNVSLQRILFLVTLVFKACKPHVHKFGLTRFSRVRYDTRLQGVKNCTVHRRK